MELLSVYDKEFAAYGAVLEGYDFTEILRELDQTECPENRVLYVPSHTGMEKTVVAGELENRYYGGMPIQIGYCNGQNDTLNCLEYHRDDEVNICATDIILLLAKQDEMRDYSIHSDCVKAFLAPAGTAIMLRSCALHYAPCHVKETGYFRVAVVLPRGTNTDAPKIVPGCEEDKLLWGRNKWLIAHPDAPEAAQGAYIGLLGENLTVR